MNIDELTGDNYDMALMNVARIINRYFGNRLSERCSSTNDWMNIEDLCCDFNIKFTEDGKVIERRES